jgi:hypothetical protein
MPPQCIDTTLLNFVQKTMVATTRCVGYAEELCHSGQLLLLNRLCSLIRHSPPYILLRLITDGCYSESITKKEKYGVER